MAALHGGARPGSGPKPKSEKDKPATTTQYADALAYLEAVVRGEEPADGLRIAAAKVCLPYQQPKKRAPIASPAPQQIRAKAERTAARQRAEDWEETAKAIKAKHGFK